MWAETRDVQCSDPRNRPTSGPHSQPSSLSTSSERSKHGWKHERKELLTLKTSRHIETCAPMRHSQGLTRTLPGIFLKISGFRVVSKYHFQCRIISMTLISQKKWPFTRLINCQNFPHPSDMKTFVTIWSMEFPQQLNTTNIIWRSRALPRHPRFGDDDSDNDTFHMQNTHIQSRFTLPATLPVTWNFSHNPTRTLPEVKKPYSSVSAPVSTNLYNSRHW